MRPWLDRLNSAVGPSEMVRLFQPIMTVLQLVWRHSVSVDNCLIVEVDIFVFVVFYLCVSNVFARKTCILVYDW